MRWALPDLFYDLCCIPAKHCFTPAIPAPCLPVDCSPGPHRSPMEDGHRDVSLADFDDGFMRYDDDAIYQARPRIEQELTDPQPVQLVQRDDGEAPHRGHRRGGSRTKGKSPSLFFDSLQGPLAAVAAVAAIASIRWRLVCAGSGGRQPAVGDGQPQDH